MGIPTKITSACSLVLVRQLLTSLLQNTRWTDSQSIRNLYPLGSIVNTHQYQLFFYSSFHGIGIVRSVVTKIEKCFRKLGMCPSRSATVHCGGQSFLGCLKTNTQIANQVCPKDPLKQSNQEIIPPAAISTIGRRSRLFTGLLCCRR